MSRPRKIITAEQAVAAWEAAHEYQREYQQRPDVKARIREYQRKEQIARLEAKLARLRAEA